MKAERIRLQNAAEYTFSDGRTITYLDFLKDRRIELNTIENEVQPQRFWNWLKDKLIETFPNRDYNRAIDTPDYVLTNTMINSITKLKESLTSKLEKNVIDIQRDYRNTNNGFLDTAESLAYTRQYLKNKLENDENIQNIDLDLQAIIDKNGRTRHLGDYLLRFKTSCLHLSKSAFNASNCVFSLCIRSSSLNFNRSSLLIVNNGTAFKYSFNISS